MISIVFIVTIAICIVITKGEEIGRKNATRNRKKLRNL
jgi:hypothetical protein